jgi:hypothetical protein
MRSMLGLTLRRVTPLLCSVFSNERTPQKIRNESAGRTTEPRRLK